MRAHLGEGGIQGGIVRSDEVREQVQFPALVFRGDLDAGEAPLQTNSVITLAVLGPRPLHRSDATVQP